MLILFHIIAALSSLLLSAYTFFVPSIAKARTSKALILLTFVSGTYLVITLHSPLVAACTSGLVYLSAVLTVTVATHRKLTSLEKVEKSESIVSKKNLTD